MINKFFALILLFLVAPIIASCSIIIFIDDGFPIFFTQERIGRYGKKFKIFKLRTMKKDTPNLPTHRLKETKKIFIRSGPFFRKFSIDELPQLINILKGEMIFIGPRPALYNQKKLIKERKRLSIDSLSPGVTGWAQINGRDLLDTEEKVKMDYYYLKNQSLSLDIRILFLTVIKAIKADGVYS
jgi:O-antigen biosynthesis protein WbqP